MNSGTDSALRDAPESARPSLGGLALLFSRLGATAFGGPAAHIALMEEEVVRRRGWLTREAFLDLLGAANLLPGPSSTELALYTGYRLAGPAGLLITGLGFVLPATLMVTAIAWAYVRFDRLPEVGGVLYGVKPVIIAVVVQAIWRLLRTAVKTRLLAGLGAVAAAVGLLGAPPLAVLFGAGAVFAGMQWAKQERKRGIGPLLLLLALGAILLFGPLFLTSRAAGVGVTAAFGLAPLFLVFLKIGSVLYGSGYVLLAFLRADLIARYHWLTPAQLLDATAVGQVTPGPVFTTATFIGYVLGGLPGAAAATVGIFSPAFLFVGVSGPRISRLRRSPLAGSFLDGVNVASLALMAVVTAQLGRAAIIDIVTAGLALASAVLLLRFRWNSVWLVLGGALIGLLVTLSGVHRF